MKVFIDESGDHDLINIDKQYPFFCLGALIISDAEYEKMRLVVNEIKKEFFGDENFILHAAELKRPNNKKSDPRNKVMDDKDFRKSFYDDFTERVIKAFNFKIVYCVIRKGSLNNAYVYPVDPYFFSFENILNRIIKHGGKVNNLYAEKRNEVLDTELEALYKKYRATGIRFHNHESVSEKTSLNLINKNQNINGLQVIDLALSCSMRDAMGKTEKMKGNDLCPNATKEKIVESTVFPAQKK